MPPHSVHFYHSCFTEWDEHKAKIGLHHEQAYMHICCANAYMAKHLEEDLTFKVSDPTLLYFKRSPLLSSYNVKFLHLDDSLQCTKMTCSKFFKSVSFQHTKHNSVTLKAKYTVLLHQNILVNCTECNWILSTVCLGCHSAM